MANPKLLRRILLRSPLNDTVLDGARLFFSPFHEWRSHYSSIAPETLTQEENPGDNNSNKWFTLPPYTSTVDGGILGKEIARNRLENKNDAAIGRGAANPPYSSSTTALKWVVRCCPELPRSLVQKLFRLRQVRRESCDIGHSEMGDELQKPRLRRVTAKDSMNLGDRIYLPISVQEFPVDKKEYHCNEEEVSFIRSLELYKDPAIIVVNKPPGMPVQGGIGIKRSLDELAATCLSYDCLEPPRLVHRLDRDSSGILVMGRTQTSATVLHTIFREKTFGASHDVGNRQCKENSAKKVLGTCYWISKTSEGFHLSTSEKGYTWLELSPITGRKHQLRVHCAEVLGTPILGDYKYGWQAHKNWKPFPCSNHENNSNEVPKRKILPFGLDLDNGDISDKHPRLHLHCKQMVLPDISLVLQNVQLYSDYDLSHLESIKLVASLPSHMQRSWELTNS
ncbi:RNA pseudouridine synthase 4, mitochondrial isoform X5 [Ziziphus jujuba]|uniref:RNA pseudouridine synthase 4, mitochondrial isoform X5 n=1 Tax=Ziziphus jujuba TaxID=326968 RepID=A0ABM3IX49_ZIZJJ|nr:RNA pseudouridine synthase 4, mitochondrial isoform X5 [Ziziphus jujuba]